MVRAASRQVVGLVDARAMVPTTCTRTLEVVGFRCRQCERRAHVFFTRCCLTMCDADVLVDLTVI
jgi:hypothetical protein